MQIPPVSVAKQNGAGHSPGYLFADALTYLTRSRLLRGRMSGAGGLVSVPRIGPIISRVRLWMFGDRGGTDGARRTVAFPPPPARSTRLIR